MSEYHTSAIPVATGLRRLATDLAQMGHTSLPEFSVTLNIQVSTFGKERAEQEAERVAAVKALMAVLTPLTPPDPRVTSNLFGTPGSDPVVYGINVCIFTGVMSGEERRLRDENDRLRAQLADATGGAR